MRYPRFAEELAQLLEEDQKAIKRLSRTHYWHEDVSPEERHKQTAAHKLQIRRRTERMLKILHDIGEPSISNIGHEGAIAISVLAIHDAQRALSPVLEKFEQLHAAAPEDCHYQSIPPMTDCLLILQRKPQRFGTQWLFDKNKCPFLPTVEDFAHVNERRAAYGLEPLRWPKSLAIPASEQPWLKQPLSEMIMRNPTPKEFEQLER